MQRSDSVMRNANTKFIKICQRTSVVNAKAHENESNQKSKKQQKDSQEMGKSRFFLLPAFYLSFCIYRLSLFHWIFFSAVMRWCIDDVLDVQTTETRRTITRNNRTAKSEFKASTNSLYLSIGTLAATDAPKHHDEPSERKSRKKLKKLYDHGIQRCCRGERMDEQRKW